MTVPIALESHYRALLGLVRPWKITDIALDVETQRIDITLEWPQGRKVPCPECGKRCGIKDHREPRTWRHLDTMQFQTFLHCRIPRADCPMHGALTIEVPWSEQQSRWTLLFEDFAVYIMGNVESLSKAAAILGISWDEASRLRTRAVQRGLQRRTVGDVEYLGIDEKSFGRKKRFITVLCDLTGERVLEVAPSKSTAAAETCLGVISKTERSQVRAVAMDMSAAMERACRDALPCADIVYDKFHIEKHLGEAMGKVRASEHKKLLAQGIPVFKRTRYLFLRRPERWSKKQRAQFRDIKREFGATRFSQSRIGRMWAIKESFRLFWNYSSPTWARKYFRRWFFWATHSRLKPVIKVAWMLERHLENIMTYFRHGITNAYTENINEHIQEIKTAARGFRNLDNYRTAILFHCGKLDMRIQKC
jgi:transposase